MIADDFGSKSFSEHYFQQDHNNYYMTKNFEVSGFMSSRFDFLDLSILSRFRNSLVNAAKDQTLLPHIVAIVPEDNILTCLMGKNDLRSFTWGKVIHWIMQKHTKVIESHKDKLPLKAKRKGEPYLVWIELPKHKNFRNNHLREKFNVCLRNMAKLNFKTSVLGLKKVWDESDGSYFIQDSDRFTTLGYSKYWEAVDRTIRYADTTFLLKQRIQELKPHKPFEEIQFDVHATHTALHTFGTHSLHRDRYHWRNNNSFTIINTSRNDKKPWKRNLFH